MAENRSEIVYFRLEPSLKQRLERVAEDLDRKVSDTVRVAVKRLVEDGDGKR